MAGLHLEPSSSSCVPPFSRPYARRLEGVQIAVDAGQQVHLAARRGSFPGTANVAQSSLAVSGAREGCAEGIEVSRGLVVFRLNRFLEFAYSFLVLLLIHQNPTKVEVRLAITGFVFNGTSVFCRGFRNKASPLEEVPEIVVSVGVIGVDINGLPKCILCRLKLFCS